MYLLGNGGQVASPGEAFHYGSVPTNLCLLASAKCARVVAGRSKLRAFLRRMVIWGKEKSDSERILFREEKEVKI